MNAKTRLVAEEVEVLLSIVDASPETKDFLRRKIEEYGRCQYDEGANCVALAVGNGLNRVMGWEDDDDEIPF